MIPESLIRLQISSCHQRSCGLPLCDWKKNGTVCQHHARS